MNNIVITASLCELASCSECCWYFFDFPLLTVQIIKVVGMTRTIEVSHWGNIAVEETYHMKHVGAELKVFFFYPLVPSLCKVCALS